MLWRVNTKERAKRIPTGEYDQFLCASCEGRFNKWDDHAYKMLLENIDGKKVLLNPDRMLLEHYDYKKLKLFFLSLLWRLDASNRGLGASVDLGEKHRTRLAKAILAGNALSWQEYAVYLERIHQPDKTYAHSTLSAEKVRENSGRNSYRFFMAGYRVHFLCDSKALNNVDKKCHINEDKLTEVLLLPLQGTEEEEMLFACAQAEYNKNDTRF